MRRVRPTELAWLAGLLDGEGAFYIGRQVHQVSKRCIYKPDIRVEMVDEPTIRRVSSLLESLKVSHTFKSLKMKNPRHRPRHIVWLKGHEAVARLARTLLPYLVTKRKHADLLVRFCAHRKRSNVSRYGGGTRYLQVTYGPQDVAMYEEGRSLNKRGTHVSKG